MIRADQAGQSSARLGPLLGIGYHSGHDKWTPKVVMSNYHLIGVEMLFTN